MTTSSNLKIEHLVSNAASPEIPVNEAFDLIDSCVAGQITINFASDADLTLSTTGDTPQQWQYLSLKLTDTGVVLTTARNVIVPANKKSYLITNNTAQILTVKTPAGSGIAVPASGMRYVYCDGTNIIDAGGNNISDVDATDLTDGGDSTLHYHASDRSRANHTGTQSTATIAGLDTALAGKQPLADNLTSLAGLTGSADRLPYFTGAGALSLAALTAFGRSFVASADAAAGRVALGVDGLYNSDLLSQLISAEVAVIAAVTLDSTAFGKMHICSGASDYVVTLPPVTGNAGKIMGVRIARAATGLVTIDGSGSELIDGELTRVMWARESAILLCDGIGWAKIAGRSIPMICEMTGPKIELPSAVNTTLSFTAAPVDNTGRMADTVNGRINIVRAGRYRCRAYAGLVSGSINDDAGISAAGGAFVALYVHTSIVRVASTYGSISDYLHMLLSESVGASPANWFKISVYQKTGATQYTRTDVKSSLLVEEEVAW